LEHIEVRVRHRQRANATGAQDVFEREILLVGPLAGDQRARLLTIADKCPVSRTLSAGALIETSLVSTAPLSAVED
jgi:putative redox protein